MIIAVQSPEDRSQRPSAEELGKSKWMKSVAKTPLSVLRDLIVRYDNFIAEKGPRASLSVPLEWEEDEGQEYASIYKFIEHFLIFL